jgi:uncharacterized OB-fold protein
VSAAVASLPTPAPAVSPEAERFWNATAEGKLLLPRCRACASTFWYPRGLCPSCGATDLEWTEASGQGTIYSFTVIHRGEGAYRDATPYVVAYVELDEGPRLLTNVVDTDPDTVTVGQAVEVVFHDTGEGNALPRFRPAAPDRTTDKTEVIDG